MGKVGKVGKGENLKSPNPTADDNEKPTEDRQRFSIENEQKKSWTKAWIESIEKGVREETALMMKKRLPLYLECADVILNSRSLQKNVEQVIGHLEKYH